MLGLGAVGDSTRRANIHAASSRKPSELRAPLYSGRSNVFVPGEPSPVIHGEPEVWPSATPQDLLWGVTGFAAGAAMMAW